MFEGDDLRMDDPRFSVENRQKVAAFADGDRPVAEAHGASVAELVIAWTLRQPGITFALCGARNPAQAMENARAGAIRLDDGRSRPRSTRPRRGTWQGIHA